MDVKSVTIFFVILCIVKCSEIEKSLSPDRNLTLDASESRVSKNYEKFPEQRDDFSDESDRKSAPPDHVIPVSEHEDPEEPPTSPKKNPTGGLEVPRKVNLDFVPTKIYAQVRKTHTVKHLPREDAFKSATNREEILAAPRLREVVKKSKSNTIYTEEGYEDAAYDHAGHIRDADFHEGYARKLDDEKNRKKDTKRKLRDRNESEEKSNEDDVSDDKTSERTVSEEDSSEEKDSTTRSDDYEDDYRDESSEMKNSRYSKGSRERTKAQGVEDLFERSSIHPKRFTENNIEKLEEDLEREYEEAEKNAEREVPENLKHVHGEESSEESSSENDHNRVTDRKDSEESTGKFSESSGEAERTESQDEKPESSISDYGKIFWDYFKNMKMKGNPKNTSGNDEKEFLNSFNSTSSPKSFSTLSNFDSNVTTNRPSISSLYESWRRQDENSKENSEENIENHTVNSGEKFEEEKNSDRGSEGSTTVIGPKKLSYTVIIRSSEKPTTESRACDRQVYTTPGEKSVEKSVPRLDPEVTKEAKDFSFANDFTVIQPPLPMPLGQVTYADFLPDSYSSLDRPSVTPEIEIVRDEGANNGERDRYEFFKNLHVNRGRFPHLRKHREKKRHPRIFFPITKLVPPSPINRSKYSNYFGVRRRNPIQRVDRFMSLDPWPRIMNFYHSAERKIFGRRKRSISGDEKFAENKRQKRRNFRDFSYKSIDDNEPKKNKNFDATIEKNDEDVLHEAPKIVDEVINDEIKTRFQENSDEDNESREQKESSEENGSQEENYEKIQSGEEQNSEEENEKKIEIEVPEFNFSEVLSNKNKKNSQIERPVTKSSLDTKKYPFYENLKIRSSALKYMTNPKIVPRKTFGGTEFYDSRDKYRECVEPGLESVLPEEEEPSEDREQGGQQRLGGLGDKLDCFRAKYFDEDPLDNPLFLEKRIGQPQMPEELAPKKIASRKLALDLINDQTDDDYQIARRISRRPEPNRREERKKVEGSEKNRVNYEINKDGRGLEKSKSSNPNQKEMNRQNRIRRKKIPRTTTMTPEFFTPYQQEVYEDVMGTIKNLATLFKNDEQNSSMIQANFDPVPIENYLKFQHVLTTESPITLSQELLPPPPFRISNLHPYRIFPYRTNKVSYRLRPRTERSPSKNGVKIAYFRTVKVHKRSIDEKNSSNLTHSEENSNETPNVVRKIRSTVNFTKNSRVKESDLKSSPSERTVYTIFDRIRKSKPEEIFGRYGMTESSATDARRREPRYNKYRSRNSTGSNNDSSSKNINLDAKSTTRSDYHVEPGEMYKIQLSTTHGMKVEPQDSQSTNDRKNKDESPEVYEPEEETNEQTRNKPNNETNEEDSPENVEDFETPNPLTESPAFVNLRKYLETGPPGYTESSDESSSTNSQEEKSYRVSETRREPSEETEKESEENENKNKQIESSSESEKNENSSKSEENSQEGEKSSSESGEVEDRMNNSEEEENNSSREQNKSGEDKNNSNEEKNKSSEEKLYEISQEQDSEKEFMHFAYRPYSPFESNEDPKYMDLGPRLSKPSFHHPSFSSINSRRQKYSGHSEESEEDVKSRYVFPWENDKSEEASGESRKFVRHEYPWERRERKARERERHRELYGFSAESDEDVSETRTVPRFHSLERTTPKSYLNFKLRRKIADNVQGSSDQKPRYSSRYRNFDSNKNDLEAKTSKSVENKTPVQSKYLNSTTPNSNLITTSTKPRGRNSRIITTTASTSTIPSRRRTRIWSSTTLGTTAKPSIARRRKNRVNETSIVAASEKKEIIQEKNENPSLTNLRKNRRLSMNPAQRRGTSTTSRPLRRRIQMSRTLNKSNNNDNNHINKNNTNDKNETSTTPKSKTIEHRSRFSKEEIITKTSYPELKKSGDDEIEEENDENERESVKKVSITTKETPDLIYRTEEIDKDGVKGMHVSIRRNNGTSSPISAEEDFFMDDDDEFENSEERENDFAASFDDSYVLAHRLMMQAPWQVNNFPVDEDSMGIDFPDEPDPHRNNTKLIPNYIKDPDQRLYYFVED